MIDGEVVAFDDDGRPSFNVLQNLGTRPETPLAFFVFDVMIWRGRDVMGEPLTVRREIVSTRLMPLLSAPVLYVPPL